MIELTASAPQMICTARPGPGPRHRDGVLSAAECSNPYVVAAGPSRVDSDDGAAITDEISTENFHGKTERFQGLSPTRAQVAVDNRVFRSDTALLVIESSLLMSTTSRSTEHTRAYRQRLRAAGSEEVLLQLPRATVAMLDAIKERQGLKNRSQALLQLIEQKGAAAQQTT